MKKAFEWINEPQSLVYIHFGFMIFWVVLWVVASITGWMKEVAFVSHLSMAALFLSSWAALQGARTEVKEDESD